MSHLTLRGLFIICLAACFYLYEFIVRVSPSVLTASIMSSFSIDAAVLGLVSAFFFYAYIPMQVPAGLICDHWGPRRVLVVMVLLCALGVALFAFSPNWQSAAMARFLVGFCASFAPVSAFILCHQWMPKRYFAMAVGLIQTLGCVGGVLGGAPIARLASQVGWKQGYYLLAVLGVVIWIFVALFVRDNSSRQTGDCSGQISWSKQWALVRRVMSNRQTWFIAWVAFSFWVPMSVFTELWGVDFISVSRGLGTTSASIVCQSVWVGVGLGGPLIGWLSDRLSNRKGVVVFALFLSLASLSLVVYTDITGLGLRAALFGLGVGCSGMCLTFGLVGDINRAETLGTAIGFNNMATILGGGFLQPLVGWLLRALGSPHLVGGVPQYTLQGYQESLTIVPVVIIMGLFVAGFFLRETYCQKQGQKQIQQQVD